MLLMMMMVVFTMSMVVEVMIEVVVNNIFAQLWFEILSQYDNSLSQDDNSFHTMIILSYVQDVNPLTSSFAATGLASCLLVNPSH